MDALNFLLEATENLNDGTATMTEGLYLDMMNRLRDIHRTMSQHQPPAQPQIVRVAPQPEPNLIGHMPLARQMAEILDVPFQTLLNHWFAIVWADEEQKRQFIHFLTLLVSWKVNGYAPEAAIAIGNHGSLNFALSKFARYSMNETHIPWKDLVFRDKFLCLRPVAKARVRQIKLLQNHTQYQISHCLRTLNKRDATYSPEVRMSMMLYALNSSFMGEWRAFRNVWKRRSDMEKLHELEVEFNYGSTPKKLKVWTDRIQLGRTALVRSTVMLGFIHAINEGEKDKITPYLYNLFGNIGFDDAPEMVASGITVETKDKMREYVGGVSSNGSVFRIRYTQALNTGGKKKK